MAIPLPSYTEIASLTKKGMTLEAQEKIMELREAALASREENLELKERVAELEDKQKLKDDLVFHRGLYWMGEPQQATSNEHGPFCTRCFDDTDKLIRLHDSDGNYYCYVCRLGFDG